LVDAEVELAGVRVRATDLYESGEAGWSIAIPAGKDEYDVIKCLHVAEISTKVKTDALRRLFNAVPTPKIARALGAVRNRYFVLIADKIYGKFFRARKRLYPSGRMDFFYVFASKWTANGIKGRLFRVLGKLYRVRGERMGQSLKFELYGELARVKEWFLRFGERLLWLSERILGARFVPRRVLMRARAVERATREDAEEAKKLVLVYAKKVSEEFYRNVAALAAVA